MSQTWFAASIPDDWGQNLWSACYGCRLTAASSHRSVAFMGAYSLDERVFPFPDDPLLLLLVYVLKSVVHLRSLSLRNRSGKTDESATVLDKIQRA
eukprot:2345436-Pleurochrysis_carterae.AAC.2